MPGQGAYWQTVPRRRPCVTTVKRLPSSFVVNSGALRGQAGVAAPCAGGRDLGQGGASLALRGRLEIAPVLPSQVVRVFGSNARSGATICAIAGGGVGLARTRAMFTRKGWEEVRYSSILRVLMVMLMSSLSGWPRRRLIEEA